MQRIETLQMTVYPCHCDVMGHLTTSQYTLLFDAATWALLRHANVHDNFGHGATEGWADVDVNVKYQREVRVGTIVTILSGFSRIGNKSVAISHWMFSALQRGSHASYVSTTVRFDLQNRIAIPVPPRLHEFLLDPDPASDQNP